jgi:hypothetical protein
VVTRLLTAYRVILEPLLLLVPLFVLVVLLVAMLPRVAQVYVMTVILALSVARDPITVTTVLLESMIMPTTFASNVSQVSTSTWLNRHLV